VSDVHNHLDDQLEVTLLIGSEPPYKEVRGALATTGTSPAS
jgi:hypothetical protein